MMMAARRSSVQRSGFTLIELMVAITITGLVALLAYSAITAGLDTLDRVDTHRRESQTRALLRPLLSDALRHIAEGGAEGTNVFEIPAASPGARSALTFLTRGVEAPMGASALWKVSLATSADGLIFKAVPVGGTSQSSITSMIPGVREMRVRVLPTREDVLWVTNWESPRQHPYAVKIELLDSAGMMIGAPLVVATSLPGRR